MIRVKSQRDYRSHLQMGRSGRRLLISGGRQWGEGSVGLALIVSYCSVDLTSGLRILVCYSSYVALHIIGPLRSLLAK
jgi:hypothetical protein